VLKRVLFLFPQRTHCASPAPKSFFAELPHYSSTFLLRIPFSLPFAPPTRSHEVFSFTVSFSALPGVAPPTSVPFPGPLSYDPYFFFLAGLWSLGVIFIVDYTASFAPFLYVFRPPSSPNVGEMSTQRTPPAPFYFTRCPHWP